MLLDCRLQSESTLARSFSLSLALFAALSLSLSLALSLSLSLAPSLSISIYLSLSLSRSLTLTLCLCLCLRPYPYLYLYIYISLSLSLPLSLFAEVTRFRLRAGFMGLDKKQFWIQLTVWGPHRGKPKGSSCGHRDGTCIRTILEASATSCPIIELGIFTMANSNRMRQCAAAVCLYA